MEIARIIDFPSTPFPLWPEHFMGGAVTNESCRPTLTVYKPSNETDERKPAVVICPGGAYRLHATHEGKDYAQWLASHGVICFVLHYRLGAAGCPHPAAFNDLARSLRLIRLYATSWNVDPCRIGVVGSSAGGHLASMLLTHHDKGQNDVFDPIDQQSCRPDFGVLCYPVISMGADTHAESKMNLLGATPSLGQIAFLSSQLQVSQHTPPCFIWHTVADGSVKVENSLSFASALSRHGVPFELHLYETGCHGMGLETVHPWADQCITWLKSRSFIR